MDIRPPDGASEIKPIDRSLVRPGEIILDRYEVLSYLGSGSMGCVVLVADRQLSGTQIALKFLYPHLVQDEKKLSRFRQEVQVMRQLTHQNIIRTYDFGQAGDQRYFISMEYVGGGTLRAVIEQGLVSLDEAVSLLWQIACGMAVAQQHGVIHRDLKPDNVLIAGERTAKIADFGVARIIGTELELTRTGESIGTPIYMSPEQFRGLQLDERSDIYSFGILAFELLSQQPPFSGESFFDIANKHFVEPLPRVKFKGAKVPMWLEDLVQRCTAKSPEKRFSDFRQVEQILALYTDNNQGGKTRSAFTPVSPRLLGKRVLMSFDNIWMVLLVLLAVGLFSLSSMSRKYDWMNLSLNAVVLEFESLSGHHMRFARKLHRLEVEASEESLLRAVSLNDDRRLRLVLRYGIDPNTVAKGDLPILAYAVRSSTASIVAVLIENGADPTIRFPGDISLLMQAVRMPGVSMTSTLVKLGAPWRTLDANGKSIFTHLFENNVSASIPLVVQELLRSNVDPNLVDGNGNTALHLAVQHRMKREVIEDLLKANADRSLRNNDGETALDIARRTARSQAILSLLEIPE